MSSDRNKKLAKLHVLKNQAGLSDETYRDKLELVTGKRSAAELDDAGLDKALAMFHAKQNPQNGYTRLAKALWISAFNLGEIAEGNDAALDGFVTRQTGKLKLQFLTPSEANKVSEALKVICARAGFTLPAGDKGGLESRKALLLAQWTRMAALGLVRIASPFALDGYVSTAYLSCHGGVNNLEKWHLDDCARSFGRKIRAAQKKREAATP